MTFSDELCSLEQNNATNKLPLFWAVSSLVTQLDRICIEIFGPRIAVSIFEHIACDTYQLIINQFLLNGNYNCNYATSAQKLISSGDRPDEWQLLSNDLAQNPSQAIKNPDMGTGPK